MTYENINFKYKNMCVHDNYFFTFDHDLDVLIQKVDDGSTAFTYPTDVSIGVEVKSLEYGGGYFWSLQYNNTTSVIIKKWKIENFICILVDSHIVGNTPDVDSDTFSIENYDTVLASGISTGNDYLYLDDYYSVTTTGTLLMVGPNDDAQYEYKTVTTVSGNKLFTDSVFDNNYLVGSDVNLATNVWLFNNESFVAVNPGSLFTLRPDDLSLVSYIDDIEYENILSSTFGKELGGVFSSTASAIMYTKSSNLKFIDVSNFSNVAFMVMDNTKIDGMTIIPVYDVGLSNATVFRLQDEAAYYGVNYSWTNYNYQVSTTRRFVDSMTVDAVSKILNSDGVSTAEVISTVFDQYNDPIFLKLVFFEDDDSTGYMTISPAYTNTAGVGYSYYRAGTTPAHVTITATATQND